MEPGNRDLRADGRLVWVRVRGEPIIEGDRVVRVRGILQDIDEPRRAAQRLRSSEERLARIFQLLPYPLGFSRRGLPRKAKAGCASTSGWMRPR